MLVASAVQKAVAVLPVAVSVTKHDQLAVPVDSGATPVKVNETVALVALLTVQFDAPTSDVLDHE